MDFADVYKKSGLVRPLSRNSISAAPPPPLSPPAHSKGKGLMTMDSSFMGVSSGAVCLECGTPHPQKKSPACYAG